MVLYAICQVYAFALVIAIKTRQDDTGKKDHTYGSYTRVRPSDLTTPVPEPTKQNNTIGEIPRKKNHNTVGASHWDLERSSVHTAGSALLLRWYPLGNIL